MIHATVEDFWTLFHALPKSIQELARKNYKLLKADPFHPSLHFKQVDGLWSVRVGSHYRAVSYREDGTYFWFWIGHHSEYDKLIT